MLTNKKAIEYLIDYFLKQDSKDVARTLANCMLDLNRIINIHRLSDDDASDLLIRIKLNNDSLVNFVKNGSSGPLQLTIEDEN